MPYPVAAAHDEQEDMRLVRAVVGGDAGAFRELILRYKKLVVSIVFRMIPQREDGEDLCQDIFVRVYEKLATLRFQSKLSTWIGSIAFHTCINFLQKRKLLLITDLLHPGTDDDESPEEAELSVRDSNQLPDEQLEAKERQALLQVGMQRLSIIQRTVLQLFHQQELSLQDIAVITSLPVSTVKSHLFRARKQLRKELGSY